MAVKPNGVRIFFAGLAAAALVVTWQAGPAPGNPATIPPCDGAWHPIKSANAGATTDYNVLQSVAALSPSSVWAVGNHVTADTAKTLIEHWDGARWVVQSTPSPGPQTNYLDGVTAVGPKDVWAVGTWTDSNFDQHPLTLHWNGSAWNMVMAPTVGANDILNDVSASADDDVWAGGYYFDPTSSVTRTLVEHWDGAKWTHVTSPNPGDYNKLFSVTSHFSDNAWVVGYEYASNGTGDRTLAEFWNGNAWSRVQTPDVGLADELLALTENTAHDLWAVGEYKNKSNIARTLAVHGTGTAWKVVPTPNANTTQEHNLLGVSAVASDDVWAVGTRFTRGMMDNKTLTLHWNGTAWRPVTSPNVVGGANRLAGVSADSSKDVWAVGDRSDSNGTARTLVERLCRK
jgi:hypothetical protein